MLKVSSPLTPAQEAVVSECIGCGISVHRALGPGFKESIYQQAFLLELALRGIRYESEKPITVKFKQWEIPGQKVDLIVEGVVVVELKSVSKLKEIHRRQLLSYLKTTGLRVGLLMNFNTLVLKQGLKRVVL